LDFLLDLAAEAIGVGEADLDPETLRRQRVANVGLARQGGGVNGQPLLRVFGVSLSRVAETVEVVDDAGRGALEQARRRPARVCDIVEPIDLSLGQVGYEAIKRVA